MADTRFERIVTLPSPSVVDLAVTLTSAAVTDGAGSFTYGDAFIPLRTGMKVYGARFYWPGGHGALGVKVTLWNSATTAIATVTVPVNAEGVYYARFATPQALTAWTYYKLSVWETSGARNIYITAAAISTQTAALLVIGDLNSKIYQQGYFRAASCYAAGDAFPGSPDTTLVLGIVEPIFF